MAGEATDEAADPARMFVDFAETTAKRAPLYTTLSRAIAADPELVSLLNAAPPTQHQPVLLFAAIHSLLLAEPGEPLARWYPNLHDPPATADPVDALREFCGRRRGALSELIASRSTQTNEIGRCALLLPVFAQLARERGPLGHVDVGTSAGLNLSLPRYGYRYEPGGEIGDHNHVVIECGVRGPAPIPHAIPPVPIAIGLDRSPIDVRVGEDARWLEACVWPDQRDRFDRLRAALTIARAAAADGDHDVRRGDAVTDTADLVREVAAGGVHPVVTNTWVLSYLTTAQRDAYVAALDAVGAELDLSWVYAESPALVPGVPRPPHDPHQDITVLSVVRWRGGTRIVDHVARCHPHGYWMRWAG